jgi:hypothetical protein
MLAKSGWQIVALASAVALVSGCPAESGIESSSGRTAFVERLGVDTVSVESYTRTAEGFEGDLLIRSPVTRVAHYEASLTPEGTIERMQVDWQTPAENPDGPPPVGFTVTFDGDSATIETRGGDNPGETRMEVPAGAIPTVRGVPVSYAVLEQAVSQATTSGMDSYPLSLLSAGRARVSDNELVRVGDDSFSIDFFGSPMVASVDDAGRVVGRTGERTTLKVIGERVGDVDFASLASDFAARDARGEGMGVASPTETVDAAVAGASMEVVYSRPAKRGREIWGGLVPFDEVWRTGANAATSFTTDRDLEIGGVMVPAGSYTLWSVYTPESAQLIINSQTGQWGTAYDAEQDFARVDLMMETLPESMERFTIEIEETDEGGMLHLTWDTTRYSIPIRIR